MADKAPTGSRARRLAKLGRVAGGQGARHLAMMAANRTRSDDEALAALEKRQLALAEELVTLLGTMRGAAMKVGQSLSIVDFGLVPDSHREEFQAKLAALQDRAPKVSFKQMRKQIEQGIDGKISDVFAEFDETPVAAASIGQVYKAWLDDGRQVAVKVQYPGIASAVRADIKNLRMFAPAAARVIPGIDLRAIIAEVEERVLEELDYEHEAQNHRAFARHYREHPFIHVPEVHTNLCSDTVIVTDWVEGRPMAAADELDQAERNRIAEILFRFYMGGPHELLAFSGDPHPGNSLLMDDGRVAFIDFGLLKRIDRETSDLELAGFRALADADAPAVIRCLAAQNITPNTELFAPEDVVDTIMLTQGWFIEDETIEYTPKLTNDIAALASDIRGPIYQLFKDNDLPPAHMVQRRVEIQVLSILGQFNPVINFGEITREWSFGASPETDLGRAEQAWRNGAELVAA